MTDWSEYLPLLRDFASIALAFAGLYFGLYKDVWDRRLRRDALVKILMQNPVLAEFHKKVYSMLFPKSQFGYLLALVLTPFFVYLVGFWMIGFRSDLLAASLSTFILSFFAIFMLTAISVMSVVPLRPSKNTIKIIRLFLTIFHGLIITMFLSALMLQLYNFGKKFELLYIMLGTSLLFLIVVYYIIPQKENEVFREFAKKYIGKYRDFFPTILVRLDNGMIVRGKLENFLSSDFIEIKTNNHVESIFWNRVCGLRLSKEQHQRTLRNTSTGDI